MKKGGKDVKKTVMLAVSSALGVFTVICGALIIWQVLGIYGGAAEGEQIYSRAKLGAALNKISPALYIWLALAFIAFGVGVYCNIADKIRQDIRLNLSRLRKRVPKCAVGGAKGGEFAASVKAVHAEKVTFIILWSICGVIALSGVIYGIVYLCNPSNFPSAQSKNNVIAEVVKLIKSFIPFVTWTFLFACAIGVCEHYSAKQQIPHLKKLAAYPKCDYPDCAQKNCPHRAVCAAEAKAKSSKFLSFVNRHKINIVRIAVGCVAVAFVIAGVANRGAHDVLAKAINICTECIGLG